MSGEDRFGGRAAQPIATAYEQKFHGLFPRIKVAVPFVRKFGRFVGGNLWLRRSWLGGSELAFEVGLRGGVLGTAVAIMVLVRIEEMVVELHAGAAFVPFDVVESVGMDGPAEGLAGPGDDGVSGRVERCSAESISVE